MPSNPKTPAERGRTLKSWGQALSAGTELVVVVLGGLLAGQWLDEKFNTSPWIMLAGAVLGIIFGLYRIIGLSQQRNSSP